MSRSLRLSRRAWQSMVSTLRLSICRTEVSTCCQKGNVHIDALVPYCRADHNVDRIGPGGAYRAPKCNGSVIVSKAPGDAFAAIISPW